MMAFFPGIGAREGIRRGPPKTTVMGNPATASSATRRGMTPTKGRLPGSPTSARTKPPRNMKSQANPFAPMVRKST